MICHLIVSDVQSSTAYWLLKFSNDFEDKECQFGTALINDMSFVLTYKEKKSVYQILKLKFYGILASKIRKQIYLDLHVIYSDHYTCCRLILL